MAMSMGIGTNTQNADAGEVKGVQEEVACGVWFTAGGRVIPKSLKFRDSEGMCHFINHINVLTEQATHYCGIPTITFACETIRGGREIRFHLLFYTERQQWKILWKNV